MTNCILAIPNIVSNILEIFQNIYEQTYGVDGKKNRANWSSKLDDDLLSYHTTYKTPIGIFLYQLIYEKSFHLSEELKNKAMQAMKKLNLDQGATSIETVNDLNLIDVFSPKAFEIAALY